MKAFLVILVGIAILAIGIGIGSHELTVSESGVTATCGKAYSPQSVDAEAVDRRERVENKRQTNLESACLDMAHGWRVTAWGLTGLGAAVLLGGLLARSSRGG
jgi:hypothetical protein